MNDLTTTAEARDRTAFNRLSISKPAEKQLAGLPARKRQNVCAALTEPICEWRTQKLKQLGDVWRIRIPGEGAVRVVYQADGDAAHIVFVGEHDSYDSFRRSWDGQVRGQHVSLTESEIVMKTLQKHAKNAKNNNGQSVARTDEEHRRQQAESSWQRRIERLCERIREWAKTAQRRAADLLPIRQSQRSH